MGDFCEHGLSTARSCDACELTEELEELRRHFDAEMATVASRLDAALRRAEAAERKFAYWDAAQARNPLPAKVLELEASLDEAVGLLRLSRTMLATVAAPLAMDFPQIASEIGRTVETLVAFLKAHP